METETARLFIDAISHASGEAVQLLWALVVLEYFKVLSEMVLVIAMFYGIYRGLKWLVNNKDKWL